MQLEPTPAAGPWCADVPVFGNPLIRDLYPSGPRGLQIRPVPEVGGRCAGYARTLVRSLGDLVRVQRWAAGGPEALAHDANAERAEWVDVQALLAAVPAGWVEAARVAPLPPLPPRGTRVMPAHPPDPAAQWAEADLVPSLGWRLYQGSRAVPVLLTKLTVKQATLLQLVMPGGVDTQRRDKHVAFACQALGLASPTPRALPPAAGQQPAAQPVPAAAAPDPAAAAAAAAAAPPRLQQPRKPAWTGPPSTPRFPRELALTASVRVALRKLWRLRWDNAVKEVYWRLALDGLASAERVSRPEAVCLCGVACPGRAHHYWECPIAQAVVRAMLDSLPAEWCAPPADGAPRLHHEHVWLMFAPPPAARRAGARRLHSGVWRVVCMVALAAMNTGRRAANLAALFFVVMGDRPNKDGSPGAAH
ncbi:hypothetical protein HT031_003949 [Scenedesmus sp. PABB004]|nr:hypothetical protein HT031_003949 [Scenedesmus sp. PABB004]